MNDWRTDFRDPPADLRPLPLWVWNNDMSEERIDAMLTQLAAAGCGGVFVHPRPGLITDYLSERWFGLWRHAADRCATLGMRCHIYDEHSFPSGFGGGHVLAAEPHCVARVARGRLLQQALPPRGPVLACCSPQGAPLATDAWRQATADAPILCIALEDLPPDPWHADRPLPDCTRPETTRAFLACTHAAYARHLDQHIGNTTRFAFADEPTLPHPADGVLYGPYLRRAFLDDHGYDIEPVLPALFCQRADSAAVRHDYFSTCNRLFCTHFFRAIHDRCAELGLAFTGHVNEHGWPDPNGLPSAMAALRWMQAPGNDVLGFQFHPDDPEAERVRIARLNLRELDSIARQCGRAHSLVESCGGGGYAYGPHDMKPLEDFVLSFGVDLIDPHLSHSSLAGMRKYDWPHSISEHSPWLPDYRAQADHCARVLAALRGGRPPANRVCVLHPTNTGWIAFRADGGGRQALAALRQAHCDLIAALDAQQIDYDLADETVLAELGSVQEGRLHIGACSYELVVIPASARTLTAATWQLLQTCARDGGRVWSEGTQAPDLCAGRDDGSRRQALQRRAGWWAAGSREDLLQAIRTLLPPHICAAGGGPLPAGLCWRLAQNDGESICFLANPWDQELRCRIRLPGRGLLAADTGSGELHPLASQVQGTGQTTALQLPPRGHALWICTDEAQPIRQPAPPAWRDHQMHLVAITTDQPNVLLLDHAQLCIDGTDQVHAHCAVCDTRLWRAQGFDGPLWQKSIQYRQSFLQRDMRHTRPFELLYTCRIDTPTPDLALAVERPWLYTVHIDEQVVRTDDAPVFFDEAMRAIPCGGLLHPGWNRIRLTAERLHPLHELAPIWLLGRGRVQPAESGFSWHDARELELGDIGAQGWPHYRGCVQYRCDWQQEQACTALHLGDLDWAGTCLRVLVDGMLVGRCWPGQETCVCDCPLQPGSHRLELVVVGDCFNLLGPHHGDGLPGRWSWERPWEPDPSRTPPGAAYRRRPQGLRHLPRLMSA
ncbi:MAG: hypothetical protein ACOCXJ_01240 [Planctomycetota bacterium]